MSVVPLFSLVRGPYGSGDTVARTKNANGLGDFRQKTPTLLAVFQIIESAEFGEFFEHYICMELYGWIAYKHPLYKLSYWRTPTGVEVDFIVNENIAVEVKSTNRVQNKHLKGLKALQEENLMRHYILVCTEERPLLIDGIQVLPWKYFLEKLWNDEFEEI